MNSKLASALAEADQIEAHPDRLVRTDTKVTRGTGRDRVLQVRLTEEEYQAFQDAAADAGLPVSTYVRSALLRSARNVQPNFLDIASKARELEEALRPLTLLPTPPTKRSAGTAKREPAKKAPAKKVAAKKVAAKRAARAR
jgi:predicted DNA binding CopG/RHH family protein